MFTIDQAVDIGADFGLPLTDVVALEAIAIDEHHARAIARKFARGQRTPPFPAPVLP